MSDTTPDPTRSTGLRDRLRQLGPGLTVAAAFVGPGTVTTVSVAGADFGFALLWALIFSIGAALGLQSVFAGGTALWATIILVGVVFAFVGSSPTQPIVFARAANRLILPIVAVFLLVVMNRRDLLGDHVNSTGANIVGGIVVLIAIGLGVRSLLSAFGMP